AEMAARIVVCERQAETVVVPRRERAADERGRRDRDRQWPRVAPPGRYNHLFILMGDFVGRIRSLALALGGPGLFLVAFLDSTFLPLPGITDILLVVMVTRHESAMPLYVLLTVAGSVAGCLVMHAIGRKGGDALVRKRFAGARVERAMASLQRHGLMAVLIPSLLPPPAPFKLFVLLAGVAGIAAGRFAIAIAI